MSVPAQGKGPLPVIFGVLPPFSQHWPRLAVFIPSNRRKREKHEIRRLHPPVILKENSLVAYVEHGDLGFVDRCAILTSATAHRSERQRTCAHLHEFAPFE